MKKLSNLNLMSNVIDTKNVKGGATSEEGSPLDSLTGLERIELMGVDFGGPAIGGPAQDWYGTLTGHKDGKTGTKYGDWNDEGCPSGSDR